MKNFAGYSTFRCQRYGRETPQHIRWIYECTSQADYARAWNRFVNYICFYAHIDGDTDKVSGYSDYYDVYMNGPVYAETDDEAEPYVDEVVKIAANNGAQIQF